MYGIATLATPLTVARTMLGNCDYKILPLLGVNRHIKKGYRTLPRAFGGIGLFSFPIEQMICWMNMLVQHFGVPSVLGRKFSASLEALQLELGTNGNPLDLDFDRYGDLATPCWFKSLWERMWAYNFRIHLTCEEIPFPRKGDKLLVEILLEEGHTGDGLRQLNRVRIYLQMIFLSDIAAADGRKLGPSYLRPTKWDADASIYTFPRERPSAADWRAWRNFWESYVDTKGVLPHTLGYWMAPTHRKWQWHYDKQNDVIQRNTGVGVERFH